MGFHTVNVKLKNGNSLTKKTILNGRFLVIEEDDVVCSADIRGIKVVK